MNRISYTLCVCCWKWSNTMRLLGHRILILEGNGKLSTQNEEIELEKYKIYYLAAKFKYKITNFEGEIYICK